MRPILYSLRRRTRIVLVVGPLLLTAPAGAAVHRMFLTSATGTAKLSTWPEADGNTGLAAGDAICQNLATSAGLANPGNFVAWLSTGNHDAFCRVAGFSGKVSADCGQGTLPNAGPWLRTDDRPFSRQLQTLADAIEPQTLYPPYVDEHGATVARTLVFTGTQESGEVYTVSSTPQTCSGWTDEAAAANARAGDNSTGSDWWTSSLNEPCNTVGHLYCFEKGSGSALPAFDEPGAYVFVTSAKHSGDLGSWPEAGAATGLAAGDAICRNLATSAHQPRPESFVAFLSTTTVDALDRLTIDGPFRRPGGVRIADHKADLAWTIVGDIILRADVEVDELGLNRTGGTATGTDFSGGWSGDACADWTDGTAGSDYTWGYRNSATGSWDQAGLPAPCDQILQFYCFSNVVTLLFDDFESGSTNRWSVVVP